MKISRSEHFKYLNACDIIRKRAPTAAAAKNWPVKSATAVLQNHLLALNIAAGSYSTDMPINRRVFNEAENAAWYAIHSIDHQREAENESCK